MDFRRRVQDQIYQEDLRGSSEIVLPDDPNPHQDFRPALDPLPECEHFSSNLSYLVLSSELCT